MNFSIKGTLLFVGMMSTLALAPPAPAISLSPGSIAVDAPVAGPNPTPPTLTLQNTGDARLKWTSTSNALWLSVSPSSGNLNKTESIVLTVSISTLGLLAGTYTGTLTFSDPAASNSPQTCTVTLHMSATPRIGVSPASLTWTAPEGGPNPSDQTVTIENTGTGTLSWSASFSPSWISGNVSSGNLSSGASQNVTVSVNVIGLTPGTHTGSMMVTATGAPNSPQTVPISVTVSAAPVIGLSPGSLTFDAPQGGANPPPATLTLGNEGGGTLAWNATTDAAWLGVSPISGSLAAGNKQSLTVTVNTTGLLEGTYLAAVHVAATGASNTPQTVGVTLNVNALPKIGANPGSLGFVVSLDSSTSAPAGLSVTNTGSGTLVWSVSPGASWLSITPSGGSLGALASAPLLMTANASGMAVGHYTASVHVTDPNALNSPQTVNVDLTVLDSDLPVHAPAGQCGLMGLELLLPLLVLRRFRRRGGLRCC
jgi:hypothetical protein